MAIWDLWVVLEVLARVVVHQVAQVDQVVMEAAMAVLEIVAQGRDLMEADLEEEVVVVAI